MASIYFHYMAVGISHKMSVFNRKKRISVIWKRNIPRFPEERDFLSVPTV